MGYTHYFRSKKTSPEKWNQIVEDCKKLVANMPSYNTNAETYYADNLLLIDDQQGGEPILNEKEILFNGTDANFNYDENNYPAMSHETFHLEQNPQPFYPSQKDVNGYIFKFCKTARKPYDLIVQACLLVYKHYSPDTISLGSDGDDEEWKLSEKFVTDVLGYKIRF